MAEQMRRKRFQSREAYMEYRKAVRRRKSIQTVNSAENFGKPVINPYERDIREKLDRYVGKTTVIIGRGKRGIWAEGKQVFPEILVNW